MSDLFSKFFSNLDIVEFVEQNLILEGNKFLYTDNGREFAKQIMRYGAHIMPYDKVNGKPQIVVKGRQVGLSTLTAAMSMFFMYSEKNTAFLHCFPEIGQARRFSTKRLIELIEDSQKHGGLENSFLNNSSTATQSQVQKDFHNQNTLYVEGTSVDGRRLRGVSISGMCMMDEFASMTSAAYRNVLECSANSHFGYINNGKHLPHLVFGTPEAEGTLFQQLWNSSTMKEFYFICPSCQHELSLYYDVKSRTHAETNLHSGTLVRCQDREGKGCGKPFDKILEMGKGSWKIPPGHKPKDNNGNELDEADYEGFYVPQFLNGNITKESIDQKFNEYTAKQFYNEVLGKFYSFEDEVLTKADIVRMTTTNPDTTEWNCPANVIDKFTFMGIDWGARVSGVDDTGTGSYTVYTVLSILPNGALKLEHVSRLDSNDIERKVQRTTELMRLYNVKKCVADKGFGGGEGQRLQRLHGEDKFSMCLWGGHTKKAVSYDKTNNTIMADKHVAHEIFFDQIRQGKFCFPYSLKEEKDNDWLLDHMVNIEVVSVERQGTIKKEYRKKMGKETDGLASLIYAYTAFQFFKTSGFNLKMNNAQGVGNRKSMLAPVMSYSNKSSKGPQNYSRHDRRRKR